MHRDTVFVTLLVNGSISTGTVPAGWKHSIMTPRLKKNGLDENVPSNICPVLNLPFLSKVLEWVILRQLVAKWSASWVSVCLQKGSFHGNCHLKVFSNIVDDIDKGKCVLLLLLDLSAAFDTADCGNLKSKMLDCIQSVEHWMSSNRLLLNPAKTKFMWCCTSHRLHLADTSRFNLPDGHVDPS